MPRALSVFCINGLSATPFVPGECQVPGVWWWKPEKVPAPKSRQTLGRHTPVSDDSHGKNGVRGCHHRDWWRGRR